MSLRRSFVVQVIPHDGGRVVEQPGDFVIGLSLEDLGEQIRVVAAAGFDEEFLGRGALFFFVEWSA